MFFSQRQSFFFAGLLLLSFFAGACGGGADSNSNSNSNSGSGSGSSDEQLVKIGKRVYNQQCITCHQSNGQGVPNVYPTLHNTAWTTGDKGRLIRLVLGGMKGPITVKGKSYNAVMTAHGPILNDKQIAAVLTYVRRNFDNDASSVTTEEVTAVRAANEHDDSWQAKELRSRTGIPGSE